jgi:hypothetical protein
MIMRTEILMSCFVALAAACTTAPDASPRIPEELVMAGDVAFEVSTQAAPAGERVLVIAREPKSGLTIWERVDDDGPGAVQRFFHDAPFPGNTGVAAGTDRVVRIFVVPSPVQLAVTESRQTFGSLDEAKRALEARPADSFAVRRTLVDLASWLGITDFAVPETSSLPVPKITELRSAGNGWLITLTGPNGKSAEVSLDSEYRVLEVRKDR